MCVILSEAKDLLSPMLSLLLASVLFAGPATDSLRIYYIGRPVGWAGFTL